MDSGDQSAKKDNTSSEVKVGDQDSTHHQNQALGNGGHDTSSEEHTQQPPSAIVESSSDKDVKAREKNLRLAQAVAPPPPSMSLTSSINSSSTNTRDSKLSAAGHTSSNISRVSASRPSDVSSKRKAAGNNGGLTSSMNTNSEDRNPLRYSTTRHEAKNAKLRLASSNSREIPAGPGAVRVSTGNNDHPSSAENNVEDDEETGGLVTATPLMAEAVDDGEADKIRQLQESNEALRRQVEMALEGERKALEEMQTMARAPPANVSVVMGDAATSVVSEEPPTQESHRSVSSTPAEEQRKECCINIAKSTVIVTACCCLFCILIGVVVFAVGLDEIFKRATDTASDQVQANTRRGNLEILLEEFKPLHQDAFNWLVDTDQWQEPQLDNSTVAPSSNTNDQTVEVNDVQGIIDTITKNAGASSKVGTGKKKWMFIERYYLAVLYFSTKGDNWKNRFGWLSNTTSHCAEGVEGWFGIKCDENDSVISIELEANNLDGSFPSEIRALSNLRSIWMSGDNFDAKMNGTIPTMPANLTQIWLWNMRLSGTIPEQLFELSGLTSLRLYQNQLTGTISTSIVQLSDLKRLELVGNQLTGTIPVLPNVTTCDLIVESW